MPDDITKRETDILAFWKEREVFRRSVERDAPNGEFVFFEGPPTANAPPGIHHVIGRTFKDVIPRYKTMRGYRVRRKAGWDTHGLPVELQIEKKLGLRSKKDVEQYGVSAFNAQCRDSVWEFKKEWERLTERIGFWQDQDDPYVTFDMPYVESVWWFLKQAWGKQLLTRDYKVVPWCPRCETPLSSHEVAQGYEDDTEDPSVYVKFQISPPTADAPQAQNFKFEIPKNTSAYFLVWTTTPWTLPGNGALAVHPEGAYAVVRVGDTYLLLAAPLIARVLGEGAEVVQTMKGSDLIGMQYVPLYEQSAIGNRQSEIFSVLPADFVSFDDGTGIVHIAPAYGEDDFVLGKQHGIPLRFSVDEHGMMAAGLPGAGKFAKKADADIRSDLAARGLLFRDETIRHTYPFCWRCTTPLLYFARASWYITMSKLRTELQSRNAAIRWHPPHIGTGRMGEWLREVKDWAITRERYWGTPLPIWQCTGSGAVPDLSPSILEGEIKEGVARDRGTPSTCNRIEVVGSFSDLLSRVPKRNHYFLMRHGESEANTSDFLNTRVETSDRYPLTAEGRTRVAAAAERLKGAGITTIIASPFARMRETAEIVSTAIGIPVTYDDRLREVDLPDFDGKSVNVYLAHFSADRAQRRMEKFTKKIGQNETWDELARRMLLALRDIDQQYEGETILICSHGDPLLVLEWGYSGRTRAGIAEMKRPGFDDPHPFLFTSALTNDRGELDVHRPFIDAVSWPCGTDGCTGTMRRFPEVVDVWMDSGCMPFAQSHFPFETGNGISNLKSQIANVPVLYPASYIAEAIDQTRGWFYTLLAVATVLGWPTPYEHVLVYSHILDKEGKKMSKSKGNVVDPNAMIAKYGADVVRWYMVSVNQPWDAKLFDEQDLLRTSRKPFGTLLNVLEFWKLHGGNAKAKWLSLRGVRDEAIPANQDAGALLDQWLRARFASLHHDVTTHLDAYEITNAARAIEGAIDDLSTWWLRRSRERLRRQEQGREREQLQAQQTFTAALETLAVLMAPFAPFTAEYVWGVLRVCSPPEIGNRQSKISAEGGFAFGEENSVGGERWSDSVHLVSWDAYALPTTETDSDLLTDMATVRRICSLGLEARAAANIPVRQPLAALRIRSDVGAGQRPRPSGDHPSTSLWAGAGSSLLHTLIADELNVRAVVVDPSLTEEVNLDTTLTPALQREGMSRDLIRKVNGLRKELGLTPTNRIRVAYTTDDATLAQAIEEHHGEIERGTMSVLSPSARGGVGGGAEAETTHHPLTISGLPIALDIAREV